MSEQQRAVDSHPQSPRASGAGVDQLMGIGIGNLPIIDLFRNR